MTDVFDDAPVGVHVWFDSQPMPNDRTRFCGEWVDVERVTYNRVLLRQKNGCVHWHPYTTGKPADKERG